MVLAGLAEGLHAFSVRATDRAGNVGQPASVTWRFVPPDTTAPTVTISSGPATSTTDTGASFTFTASETGVAFECSLDGGAYAACTSPAAYQALGVGAHSFAVRGRDEAGNLGQPASFAWSIVAPPPPPPPPMPDLYVASFTKNTIVIQNRGNAAAGASSILTISVVGLTFTVPNCSGRLRHVQLGCLRRRHVCRDRRPDEPRCRIGRDEQHREPPQLLLPLIAMGLERGLELIATGQFFAAHEELEDDVEGGTTCRARLPAGTRSCRRRVVPGRSREASRVRAPAREGSAPARSLHPEPPGRRHRSGASLGRRGARARRTWRPEAAAATTLAQEGFGETRGIL